ncbi:unnamed protein product [Calypogeia fissa]
MKRLTLSRHPFRELSSPAPSDNQGFFSACDKQGTAITTLPEHNVIHTQPLCLLLKAVSIIHSLALAL